MRITEISNNLKMTPELQDMLERYYVFYYAYKRSGQLTDIAYAKFLLLRAQIKQKAEELNMDLNLNE